MKASKLLTERQKRIQWGEYVKLNMRKKGINFEKFLTYTFKLSQ